MFFFKRIIGCCNFKTYFLLLKNLKVFISRNVNCHRAKDYKQQTYQHIRCFKFIFKIVNNVKPFIRLQHLTNELCINFVDSWKCCHTRTSLFGRLQLKTATQICKTGHKIIIAHSFQLQYFHSKKTICHFIISCS